MLATVSDKWEQLKLLEFCLVTRNQRPNVRRHKITDVPQTDQTNGLI